MRRLEKTSAHQIYECPVISTDLRQEELVNQIADSLDYLQHVMDDVFTRVQNQVASNKARLSKIHERASTAQNKINHLKGRKKATQVFSSAKYPAPDKLDEYKTMFCDGEANLMKHSNFKLHYKNHSHPTDQDFRDKLKFYTVQAAIRRTGNAENEGLGRLPNNIHSVSSLLLFNTAENLYKKYVMLDPTGVKTKMRSDYDEEALQGPAKAPTTIAEGDIMQQNLKEDFSYKPEIGNVPLIEVPEFLPDLTDVADDLIFNPFGNQSIAPSIQVNELPQLPVIEPEPKPVYPDKPVQNNIVPAMTPAPPPPPPPSTSHPPPPPPPPPPAPLAAPPVVPPAAGPNPPKPPQLTETTPSKPQPEPSSDDGGRNSLLEAIRNAGGAGKAKLKKPTERKVEKKKEKQEEKVAASTGGGDLMSDLSKMLSMRRRGIAGATAKPTDDAPKPGKSEGVMSTVSQLIAYNPKSEDADDADWE